MNIKVIGIDLAKNIFQIHGVDEKGKHVLSKRISRNQLASFIAQLPPCLIGMEACSSSNYWARKFREYGHEVKLMSPQYVKPYVKTNKNDANDAAGICEAVSRPSMRFVPIKSIEQQDIQCLHRIRSGLIQERTALVNQLRGLLAEYGIVVAQGITKLKKQLPEILDDTDNQLSSLMRSTLIDMYNYLIQKNEQIDNITVKIMEVCKQSEVCQRLVKVEGIGPMIATAFVAAVGDAKNFKNGRHLAAWLGLVPRQASSGNKRVLLGISKRGDRYLRSLLIQGASAVIRCIKGKTDARSLWLEQLIKRSNKFKANVALANKNARILWALMAHGTEYRGA